MFLLENNQNNLTTATAAHKKGPGRKEKKPAAEKVKIPEYLQNQTNYYARCFFPVGVFYFGISLPTVGCVRRKEGMVLVK